MQSDVTLTRISPQVKNGVLILSGYGVRVRVARRHLTISDGIGRERRWGRFSKATCGLRRLAVLGHAGTISLEALRWLHDIGASFVQIDANGQIMAASSSIGHDDARLRRAQAMAISTGTALRIARNLVHEKLRAQAAVLKQLPNGRRPAEVVHQAIIDVQKAYSPEGLRQVESVAAAAYWRAWEQIPVTFARRDLPRVPDHWQTFGARTSPLTSSPRSAVNPANAILNYLYALLEAEARTAALVVGLDPGLGIYHADQKNRDSLACDIMEPVRPRVDDFALNLLHTRPLAARDFYETREGVCRVLPPFTHLLAETIPKWAEAVAPIAERVAQALLDETRRDGPPRRVPTLLTQANRRSGRDGVRRRPARVERPRTLGLPQACRNCGVLLSQPNRRYCDECLPDRRKEQVPSFVAAGPSALARARREGRDPAHGGEAARRRGARNAQRVREVALWRHLHGREYDPEEFKRNILPGLRLVPLTAIVRATSLSKDYCSKIRRGLRVPHPRHWTTLVSLRGNA